MLKSEIRPGAYFDSVVLMQLQRSLSELPGVAQAGVVMGTDANKDLLEQSGLLSAEAQSAAADDLIVVIESDAEEDALSAIAQIDAILVRRRSTSSIDDYRPKSLESAAKALPQANWVVISVPGRFAAGVAREALRLGKHVLLYSDNVSLADEIEMKQNAAHQGLMVMGPDCGTAIINGVGLGFANQVRRGPIGVVGASGTGLQQVTSRIHQLGSGITHALGTGGRDLAAEIGAITMRQGLNLLARDSETKVIVLISKPPSPAVADNLLRAARAAGKPVVVDFIGFRTAELQQENVYFASTLDETAALAVELADYVEAEPTIEVEHAFAPQQRYLRGLFSGGTLAYEASLILQEYLPAVYSNVPLHKELALESAAVSQEHTIVDLGGDEFTVGRLHPMMDNALRLQRLAQEAADPEVAIVLVDVVLGYGAHPDPASELAPAIAAAIANAEKAGRTLEVVAVVVGTDEDPQDFDAQIDQLIEAGATVETNNAVAVTAVGERLRTLQHSTQPTSVDPETFRAPMAAINVGLETFAESLRAQNAAVVHVDWRPPAGGDDRLGAILARMRGA